MLEILLLGFVVFVAVFILVVMFTEFLNFAQTHVPFVPTARVDLEDMIQRAGIGAEDVFYDLGSGNGKVVFAVAELAGARSKGIQRGGWTQWYAQAKAWVANKRLSKRSHSSSELNNEQTKNQPKNQKQIEFITGNFFDYSWSEASVIYGYLYPFLMRSVEEKFLADCKPGTKIIVRDFYLPNLKHESTWVTPSGHKMYLYLLK